MILTIQRSIVLSFVVLPGFLLEPHAFTTDSPTRKVNHQQLVLHQKLQRYHAIEYPPKLKRDRAFDRSLSSCSVNTEKCSMNVASRSRLFMASIAMDDSEPNEFVGQYTDPNTKAAVSAIQGYQYSKIGMKELLYRNIPWLLLGLGSLIPKVVGAAIALLPSSIAKAFIPFAMSSVMVARQQQKSNTNPRKRVLMSFWLIGLFFLWNLDAKMIQILSVYFRQFSTWYVNILKSFPLLTKSLTAGVIGTIGDGLAQAIEHRIRNARQAKKSTLLKKPFKKKPYTIDFRRSVSNFGDGVLVTAPLMHLFYNVLENLIPIESSFSSRSLAAVAHVLVDDFLFDGIFIATTFITTAIGEGYIRELIPQFRKDFIPTVKASWITSVTLMPMEFVCFRFLPLHFRVLGMNFIDIFWCTMVSFMAHKSRHGLRETDIDDDDDDDDSNDDRFVVSGNSLPDAVRPV